MSATAITIGSQPPTAAGLDAAAAYLRARRRADVARCYCGADNRRADGAAHCVRCELDRWRYQLDETCNPDGTVTITVTSPHDGGRLIGGALIWTVGDIVDGAVVRRARSAAGGRGRVAARAGDYLDFRDELVAWIINPG